jgi:hypothetical protein
LTVKFEKSKILSSFGDGLLYCTYVFYERFYDQLSTLPRRGTKIYEVGRYPYASQNFLRAGKAAEEKENDDVQNQCMPEGT